MEKAPMEAAQSNGNLVLCYVDDVMIAASTVGDHFDRIGDVLSRLKKAGLKCKSSKCEFLKTSNKYLGRIFDGEGVRPHPDSVETVMQWQTPRKERELQRFLGFYQILLRVHKRPQGTGRAHEQAGRKSVDFEWNAQAQVAFELTKEKL